MGAVDRIYSSVSEPWVAWLLLVLLVLLVVSRFFVADMALVVRGLFSRSERSYHDVSWQDKLVAWCYRIGVVSLFLYLPIGVTVDYSLVQYLLSFVVAGVVLLAQQTLVWFVGKVFLSDRQLDGGLEFRISIYNSVCAFVWPLVLVLRFCNNEWIGGVMMCVVLGLLVLLLLWKSVQLFCKNVLGVFYTLLYISVLEVFPLLFLFFVINNLL